MAVVTFNRADFESLVKKKLTDREYKEVIPMMGTPLDGLTGTEVSFEVFPNRPDLLSVEGFARAVRGFIGLETGLRKYNVKSSRYEVHADKSVLNLRGCAAFAVVKGCRFTDETVAEFMQLQDKLVFTIGRKRRKAAMGSYHLEDLNFPIKYTTVGQNYKFVPLLFNEELSVKEVEEKHPKGIEYRDMAKGWKRYPAFIDSKGNTMAVLPYTNAQFGKIKPETENILIEVTGTEWKAVFEMLNVVTTALADRGAEIHEVKTVYPRTGNWKSITAPKLEPWKMKLDLKYVNKLLDLKLNAREVKARLEKMRFGVQGNYALIPAYRTDIMHPIDLVEDVCIAHGYEKFEPRIPNIPTIGKPYEKYNYENRLRQIMLGLGFQEVVNFVLSNPKKEFSMLGRTPIKAAEIQQSKTEDYTMARISIMPSLLSTLAENASSEMPQRVFELGNTVRVDSKSETGALDISKLGAAILHSSANYSEMKAYAEAFFNSIGKKLEIKGTKDPAFIDGRAVELVAEGKKLGIMGEISPEVLSNFGIEYPVVMFEMEV